MIKIDDITSIPIPFSSWPSGSRFCGSVTVRALKEGGLTISAKKAGDVLLRAKKSGNVSLITCT